MSDKASIKVGLRIDVDTFRGTQQGVPKLLELFERYQVMASFFYTVGPDNMGRHLWRLLRPAFLKKMLRSKAASLYGWDIIFRGTLWPGPIIGKRLAHIIQASYHAGHELGLHAWDHHKWQMTTESMSPEQLHQEIDKGYQLLSEIVSAPIHCSAVAGWRCTDEVLHQKAKYPFSYNSDCRGQSIFRTADDLAPQIPVTLPTYDELIGTEGVDDGNYNQAILARIKPEQLNVYTIHAEVEGIVHAPMFEQLLIAAKAQNIEFVPLALLLHECEQPIPVEPIVNLPLPGREGWLSQQASFAIRHQSV